MGNNIEDFISANRNEFDDRSPSDKVWKNIDAAVTGKKKKRSAISPIINWVLATAAVLAIGIFIYVKFDTKEPAETGIVKTEADISDPQVNEFSRLISIKQEELKLLSKEQPELYQKFTTDIEQLDSSYNALKKQLNVSPNKEMLLEAMIQNLQLQLQVLNQQLNIIKQIKQSKESSHEKNDPFI